MDNVADGPMAFVDAIVVDDYEVEITVWIAGREYPTKNTLKELLVQAARKTLSVRVLTSAS